VNEAVAAELQTLSVKERALVLQLFDTGYYLAANPDVRAANQDPLLHYLKVGWREGRNPSRLFDTRFYLDRYKDVAGSELNPLVHYAMYGRSQDRSFRRPMEAWRRKLDRAKSPRSRVVSRKCNTTEVSPLSSSELRNLLDHLEGCKRLVISVSHDDYAEVSGGIQNLIGDEQRACAAYGWNYLHISPTVPLPYLADRSSAQDFQVNLRLDGARLGPARFSDVVTVASRLSANGANVNCVFHHLMGHVPELLADLVTGTGSLEPVVWLHDFFTLCSSYALMRNDIAFCGGPSPDSPACMVCVYGPEREGHLARMRALFETVWPSVLAPSLAALEFWSSRTQLVFKESEVMPLARIVTTESALPTRSSDRPIRVAHLGGRSLLKGWPVFEELAISMADDRRYQFFHLGLPSGEALPGVIKNVPVQVTPDRRGAMVEALAEFRIDVVVIWSFAYETFSYAAHEAIVGGSYVVTRSGAGNVWPAILANAPESGCVIDSEVSLHKLFCGTDLENRIRGSSKRFGAILPGGGTADWLLKSNEVPQTFTSPGIVRMAPHG
jgi:hypothetical protein